MIGDVFTWHWSGYFLHRECLPDDEKLMDLARQELGSKPKDVSQNLWTLMLQDQQRRVMSDNFPTAPTRQCASCYRKAND